MPYTLYCLQNEHLVALPQGRTIPDNARLCWCDLHAPEKAEEQWVEQVLGLDIPTREEMHEIEPSSRLYVEHGALYCTASLVAKTDSPEPEIHAITFIVVNDVLVTVRYAEPYTFKQFSKRVQTEPQKNGNGRRLLVALLGAVLDRLADIIEQSGHTLDALNRVLFRPSLRTPAERDKTVPDFEAVLREIGAQGDLLSKIRESLVSLLRALAFLNGTTPFHTDPVLQEPLNSMINDIPALRDQADALTAKVGFLLDAALGLVGLQQTKVIKIFSVAAVVFLPPTLVASIYGMNFDVMPELRWPYGYPFALALMAASAWLPYQIFKFRKWL